MAHRICLISAAFMLAKAGKPIGGDENPLSYPVTNLYVEEPAVDLFGSQSFLSEILYLIHWFILGTKLAEIG